MKKKLLSNVHFQLRQVKALSVSSGRLESITFPETVVSVSIEPRTSAEKVKLSEALALLRREDPTFGCKVDGETGQTIISGMGELHLEVLEHKLVRDMGVNVKIGKPRVA